MILLVLHAWGRFEPRERDSHMVFLAGTGPERHSQSGPLRVGGVSRLAFAWNSPSHSLGASFGRAGAAGLLFCSFAGFRLGCGFCFGFGSEFTFVLVLGFAFQWSGHWWGFEEFTACDESGITCFGKHVHQLFIQG